MKYLLILLVAGLCSCGNTIYIVRHAEKEPVKPGAPMMEAGDPPLSEAGRQRALVLRDLLGNRNVKYIFSTNYKRTISTAQPLKDSKGDLRIELYSSKKDSMDAFISRLKTIRNGNVLVVGHSNTIDDLANKLCGTTVVPGDLDEKIYDNLYAIKRKGDRYVFKGKKYGAKTE